MYKNLIKNHDNIRANLIVNYVQGPRVEINSPVEAEYLIEFFNRSTGELLHSTVIKNNHWTKCLYEYFIDWSIKIHQKEQGQWTLVREESFNAENKRVYISLGSKALGDTLAWLPYVEDFRKKHGCKMICSTFHNYLFEKQYSDIEFVNPGESINNLYAMYTVGWYYSGDTYNNFKHPKDFKNQAMQKTATDILGLDFYEAKPKLKKQYQQKKKQVCIAMHATAQTKYWNNPTGWQELVDWCKNQGYDVIMLSREGDGYMGNNHPIGIKYLDSYSIESTIEELSNSEAFVGLSSGLTWLSWATDTPTVIVSGFSESYTEPESCYSIEVAEGKCKGCFNTHKLDAGDWNWCPVHKGTDRQFECSKSITPKSVIDKLKLALHI